MKEFLTYNWKTITLVILGVIFVYLLVRVFTPIPDHSELNKYKLDQIDQKVDKVEKLQKELKDSIMMYKQKIQEIDTKISNIKIEKNQVNNYYTIKADDIKSADKKKIDSLFKKRYNF